MVTTKSCSDSVSALLGILTRETPWIEDAYEPVGRLVESKRGQIGVELDGVTRTSVCCLRPLLPLPLSNFFVQRLVKTPNFTVLRVVATSSKISRHVRRLRPIQETC